MNPLKGIRGWGPRKSIKVKTFQPSSLSLSVPHIILKASSHSKHQKTSSKTQLNTSIMYFTKTTLTILISALVASATNVHNQYGENGWIQDNAGTTVQLNNGASANLGGGWGFFWVSSSVCGDNSVAFTWPSNYGVSFRFVAQKIGWTNVLGVGCLY